MSLKNRLQLLTDAEIEDLYARPEFNAGERELYFSLSRDELTALKQYSTTKTRLPLFCSLLILGQAPIFTFTFDDVRTDVDYILERYYKIKMPFYQQHYQAKFESAKTLF